jgi:DNA-3-methyladenine glycosylase II
MARKLINTVGKAAALRYFRRVDPHFHATTKLHHSSLPDRLKNKTTRAQLFSSLVSIVVSQQLGTKAADSIFTRVKEACGGRITPESVLKISPAKLRKAGLSGAKTKTIKEIAHAVKNNSLDLLVLKTVPETVAAEKLMAVWGLGPWSAEMFLMFALGRSDVFSPGDLGLIRSIEAIYGLPKNAPREKILAIAQKWSPHRTYASLLLWCTRDVTPNVLSRGRHR